MESLGGSDGGHVSDTGRASTESGESVCCCVGSSSQPTAWCGAVVESQGDGDVVVVGRGRRDRVYKEIEVSFQAFDCHAENGDRAREAGGKATLRVNGGEKGAKRSQFRDRGEKSRLKGVSHFNDGGGSRVNDGGDARVSG